MLQCLSIMSSSTATATATATSLPISPVPGHSLSQGSSTDGTPRSRSTQPSPTINLAREYTLFVQSDSYNEMWSRIHVPTHPDTIDCHEDAARHQLLLTQVLHPNQEYVEEILRHAKPNTLTRLVSTYFKHSENTTHLCLVLQHALHRVRALYHPLHTLLDVLPADLDLLSQSQCNHAFAIFHQFNSLDNPFPSPDSHSFTQMRQCFLDLRQQLDHRLHKSRSRVSFVRRATAASALCVIGSVVAAAISAAVVISTHALVAIVACPFCGPACLPRKITQKELAHVKQLNAAARGAFFLNIDLDTMDCIVKRVYDFIDGDKQLIKLGLEGDGDKHPILEVLKQLRKNHPNFIQQLKILEEHICLCFNAVNRVRSLLLQEVHLYQTNSS